MTLIEAIRKREKAATEGPWKYRRFGDVHLVADHGGRDIVLNRPFGIGNDRLINPLMPGVPNADFIAHARTDIPYLLTLVEKLSGAFQQTHESISKLINARPVSEYPFVRGTEADKLLDAVNEAIRVEWQNHEKTRKLLDTKVGDDEREA